MKKRNKYGFTLIELLAVIVILGILLALAVPAITKYINSSKKSVYVDNMKMYIETVRKGVSTGQYIPPLHANQATAISFSDIQNNVERGGVTSPYGGTYTEDTVDYCYVLVVNTGTAEFPKHEYYVAAIDSNNYGIANPDNLKITIIAERELSEKNVVQLDKGIKINDLGSDIELSDGKKVTITSKVLGEQKGNDLVVGQAVTGKDGSKWHVLVDSPADQETVTLLSDYNIYSDGTFNKSCYIVSGDLAMASYNSGACSTVSYNNSSSYLNNFKNVLATNMPGSTNIIIPSFYTLYDAASITSSAKNQYGVTEYTIGADWLSTTNYWTSSYDYGSGKNYVISGTYKKITTEYTSYGSYTYGIRPQITTPKTNLVLQ